MKTTIQKTLLLALATAAVAVGGVSAAPEAHARPVDPLDEVVRPEQLGPDKSDWWCTYQHKHEGMSCVYIPGVNRPMPMQIREEADVRWNPFSWF